MFTGIIIGKGQVATFHRTSSGGVITIDTGDLIPDPVIGESIACDGVCLTVTKATGALLDFDLSKETLERSTFGALKGGARVNLERAVRLGDPMGGHLVSGHVDGLGKVARIVQVGEGYEIEITLDPAGMRYVIEKGSIALQGVSLTVAAKKERSIVVAMIPHTFRETTFADMTTGSVVNVEYDMIAKYVENFVKPDSGGVDKDFLARYGFA